MSLRFDLFSATLCHLPKGKKSSKEYFRHCQVSEHIAVKVLSCVVSKVKSEAGYLPKFYEDTRISPL